MDRFLYSLLLLFWWVPCIGVPFKTAWVETLLITSACFPVFACNIRHLFQKHFYDLGLLNLNVSIVLHRGLAQDQRETKDTIFPTSLLFIPPVVMATLRRRRGISSPGSLSTCSDGNDKFAANALVFGQGCCVPRYVVRCWTPLLDFTNDLSSITVKRAQLVKIGIVVHSWNK